MAALATCAMPDVDIVGVRADREGTDYTFAVAEDTKGKHWVVRVPKSAAAGAGQEAEVVLLRSLAAASASGSLPFEVPRPSGFAELDGGGRAMVYPQLPGVPVVMELLDAGPGLATSIGRAIGALHELPTSIAEDAGLPLYLPGDYRKRLHAEVDEAARTSFVTPRLLERWEDQLADDDLWHFLPVLIHGDMAPEHLLEENGRVSAMLDFSTVQVSDPAEDLAPLMAATGPDVADSILEGYRARRPRLNDPRLEDRAALLAEIAVVRWLLYGVRHSDPSIVTDARSMIQDLDQAVAEEELETARLEAEAQRKAAAAQERAAAVERASRAVDEETAERNYRLRGGRRPGRDGRPETADDEAAPGGVVRRSVLNEQSAAIALELPTVPLTRPPKEAAADENLRDSDGEETEALSLTAVRRAADAGAHLVVGDGPAPADEDGKVAPPADEEPETDAAPEAAEPSEATATSEAPETEDAGDGADESAGASAGDMGEDASVGAPMPPTKPTKPTGPAEPKDGPKPTAAHASPAGAAKPHEVSGTGRVIPRWDD
jgi:aminoglycoside phosphotransferase (APT) family kinase protein